VFWLKKAGQDVFVQQHARITRAATRQLNGCGSRHQE
jgi:hypothetical protein